MIALSGMIRFVLFAATTLAMLADHCYPAAINRKELAACVLQLLIAL
jgi:hypothetical protein